MKHKGDITKMIDDVRQRRYHDCEDVAECYRQLNSQFITIMERAYPSSLRYGYCPPLLLYYYGNISLLNNFKKTYAFVGSRNPSEYGVAMAKKLAGDCAKKGLILVSGMASGIDGAAMEAALDAGGKVIAVLGTGIDRPFPNINKDLYIRIKENGLVISEYPGDTPPERENFPKRNRIIAALGAATIVGESAMKSGTMITVKYATELGRDIGAVPHPGFVENGCNALIRDGAQMVETADDIVEMLEDCYITWDE